MPVTAYQPGEVALIGEEIYERDIRSRVETEDNIGKILVLDVESGDYVIHPDHHTAVDLAHERRPDGAFYTIRIGYRAVGRLGGSWGKMRR